MIRNALIAIYIFVVLAISAVSRAEISVTNFEPKRPVRSIVNPKTVDPLPGVGKDGSLKTKLIFGTSGVNK